MAKIVAIYVNGPKRIYCRLDTFKPQKLNLLLVLIDLYQFGVSTLLYDIRKRMELGNW